MLKATSLIVVFLFLTIGCTGETETRKVKQYYENGQLKSELTYKAGELEGPWKEYYESGKLKAEGLFEDGEPVGEVKKYDETGKLK